MFIERSQEKELLEMGPHHYTPFEYSDCLKKLFNINRLLGFFRRAVRLLKPFKRQNISVLDVGCGGGLFLLHLSHFFPSMHLCGMDISNTAIAEAETSLALWKKKNSDIHVFFKLQEHTTLNLLPNSFDVLLVTLVCHHLDNEELVNFLQKIFLTARKKVLINDLHRHPIAYWLYRFLSPVLFRNRLITHDGLISIKRGFTRAEWKLLLFKAGLNNYRLKWCFPFCWQLILWK